MNYRIRKFWHACDIYAESDAYASVAGDLSVVPQRVSTPYNLSTSELMFLQQ